ncbi:MAG: hypothetical protein M1820_004725 [Bogoriella megaspora]|nr:MAG: hypothetical protein M1820_004725 [Bogoriella megaspora]
MSTHSELTMSMMAESSSVLKQKSVDDEENPKDAKKQYREDSKTSANQTPDQIPDHTPSQNKPTGTDLPLIPKRKFIDDEEGPNDAKRQCLSSSKVSAVQTSNPIPDQEPSQNKPTMTDTSTALKRKATFDEENPKDAKRQCLSSTEASVNQTSNQIPEQDPVQNPEQEPTQGLTQSSTQDSGQDSGQDSDEDSDEEIKIAERKLAMHKAALAEMKQRWKEINVKRNWESRKIACARMTIKWYDEKLSEARPHMEKLKKKIPQMWATIKEEKARRAEQKKLRLEAGNTDRDEEEEEGEKGEEEVMKE